MVFFSSNDGTEANFKLLPLDTFATYVEQLIKGYDVVEEFLIFLQNQFLVFIPFGFLVGMLGRDFLAFFRFFIIVVFSVGIEVARFFVVKVSCDIDNIIFGFLGALLGMFAFLGFNELFCYFVGKNFDGSDINRDYYGRKI